jgi:hypothetical protein
MDAVNVVVIPPPEPGSFTIIDRGFLDFGRLYRFTLACAFFVIRPNDNTAFERVYSREVDKPMGLRCDQTIKLTGVKITPNTHSVCAASDSTPKKTTNDLPPRPSNFALQEIFRHDRERRQNPNLDRRQRLRSHRHHQEEPSTQFYRF